MTNLTIGKKLAVGFGACLLIMIALTLFALSRMTMLNDNVGEFSLNRLPKAYLVGSLDSGLAKYRLALANHILATDPAEITRWETRYPAARTAVDDVTAKLNAVLATPSNRSTMEKINTSWATMKARGDDVIAASRTGDKVRAKALRDAMMPFLIGTEQLANQLKVGLTDTANASRVMSDTSYGNARMMMIVSLVLALALVAFLLAMMVRLISNPLARLTASIDELAGGKLDTVIDIEPRTDEVGLLARSVVQLRDQLNDAERAKAEQVDLIVGSIGHGLAALSQGDLTHRIDADLTGPFAKLKADFNGAMDAVGGTIVAVGHSTSGIRTGSNEISQASDDLSRRTEQQAASLEETAAAMDQITATVRETASGAIRANQVVADTRVEAENGGRVVAQAVEAMGGIERASNEISEIISVIDGIAFQTNLLALNAGVEAARAGDAGRGFEVVASEVRALAQRSADAAKDVKTKIMASTGQVETGVTLVGETGRALERIVGRIGEISQLVASIAASAEQQASGLQQVNTAVGEMDSVTQQNAAMVEEATAAARSLAAEAEDLARHVARFETGVDTGHARTADRAPTRIAAPMRKPAPARRAAPAPRTHGALALKVAADTDDWSRF